jgi:lipid-A-disaccharide synthase
MLCLFPFEVEIYRQHNIQAAFVGHPLADNFPLKTDMQAARRELQMQGENKIVALLPGSRSNEVKYLLEHFIAAARFCLQRDNSLQFVLPAANEKRFHQIQRQLPSGLPIKLIQGNSHLAMTASDVVLIASGTTTLEAMLLKKPMVVSYKVSALNYAIMSRILTSEHIALPNILAGERLVPEIIQNAVNGEALGRAVIDYFDYPEKIDALQARFLSMHQQLQQSGDQRAADAILNLVAK